MERVGPWRVVTEVARGGFGLVLRARHEVHGGEAALKLLLSGQRASDAQRRRFQREAEALARLSHPGVVGVLGVGEQDGVPWLALEWIEGETLQARLERRGPLRVEEAVELGQALSDALAHAHAAGVLHRDLKPANVLLRARDGRPVLTDFGLTRALDPAPDQSRLSRTGEFLGTPGYWAPEQALGQLERFGPQTDVYGLGATLYAALTGEPPGGLPASLAEALALAERDPPPPSQLRPGVPRALDRLLLRSLARDPAQRFPTPEALGAALEALPQPGRGRRPAALAGAILGLGSIGAAALHLGWPPPAPRPGTPTHAESPPDRPASPAPRTGSVSPDPEASAAPRPDEAEQRANRAEELAALGDHAGALEALDRALERAPDRAPLWFRRGQLRAAAGDLAGASEDYDRAVELRPEDVEALLARADVRTRLGDPGRAHADCNRALALRPDDPLALRLRGAALRVGSAPERALQDLDRSLELAPDAPLSLLERSRVHVDLGRPSEAGRDLDRALELAPELGEAWRERGALRIKLRDLTGAQEDLDRALALDPGDGEVWHQLGRLAERLDDVAGALRDYERALTLRPELFRAALDRGNLRYKLGDFPGAVEDYARAVALRPLFGEGYANLAMARLQAGDSQGALREFTRAVEINPGYAPAWYSRGVLRGQAGDLDGAREDLRRAVELEPGASWAEGARARLAELEETR